MLARLAWLADVGEPFPIIEEVPRNGDPVDFVTQYVSELAVAPVEGVGDSAMELGTPRPCYFPPRIAEAFLRHLEGWVARGDFGPRNGPAEVPPSPGSPGAAQGGVGQSAKVSSGRFDSGPSLSGGFNTCDSAAVVVRFELGSSALKRLQLDSRKSPTRWIRADNLRLRGELPSVKIAARRLFDVADLRKYIESRKAVAQ